MRWFLIEIHQKYHDGGSGKQKDVKRSKIKRQRRARSSGFGTQVRINLPEHSPDE
jgi:hypothetical protein